MFNIESGGKGVDVKFCKGVFAILYLCERVASCNRSRASPTDLEDVVEDVISSHFLRGIGGRRCFLNEFIPEIICFEKSTSSTNSSAKMG